MQNETAQHNIYTSSTNERPLEEVLGVVNTVNICQGEKGSYNFVFLNSSFIESTTFCFFKVMPLYTQSLSFSTR